MRIIDADALMPLFIEKAYTMEDRHGVKLGEEWLLNYSDIKDIIDNAPTVERPRGERAERALAIIDRLRTDGHINNKEQGTLRRAILLPERSHGEWTTVKGIEGTYYCSECDGDIDWKSRYCPWCGAKMEVDYE